MTIDDLIARLAAAAEGSSELDWAVAETSGWSKFWSAMTIYLPPGETEAWADEHPAESGATTELPRFTTSVDAALTLLPDNIEWDVGRYRDRGRWYYESCIQSVIVVEAQTPTLALCIAALRAIQAQKERDAI